jgi:hypothetical protein
VLLTVTHSAIAMILQRCILPILRNSPRPHHHVSQLCVQMGLRRMATKSEAQEGTTVNAIRYSRVRRLISMSSTVQRWFRLRVIICPWCMATSARVHFSALTFSDVTDRYAVASHQHVRQSAGLFDVGHMLQSK